LITTSPKGSNDSLQESLNLMSIILVVIPASEK